MQIFCSIQLIVNSRLVQHWALQGLKYPKQVWCSTTTSLAWNEQYEDRMSSVDRLPSPTSKNVCSLYGSAQFLMPHSADCFSSWHRLNPFTASKTGESAPVPAPYVHSAPVLYCREGARLLSTFWPFLISTHYSYSQKSKFFQKSSTQ